MKTKISIKPAVNGEWQRLEQMLAAWNAFAGRYGEWILQQDESVKFSAAMAFGQEYEAVQSTALTASGATSAAREVNIMELSDETRRLASYYAAIVESYDDPQKFREAGYTPREWELRRKRAHDLYLAALKADGVDVSDRAATTSLAQRVRRWLRTE